MYNPQHFIQYNYLAIKPVDCNTLDAGHLGLIWRHGMSVDRRIFRVIQWVTQRNVYALG